VADYDVGVLGLSSPPTSAVLTSYRPAVSVRNNGIHNALASGYLRIYSAGLLIFETEVYSGTLAPGATGTADGVDYWTPPAEGSYIVQGYVTTPLDQVEPNNNLNPTTITVEGGPVPPSPTVPLHAAQHEEGDTDPINVDGLPGVLADRQPAANHAAQHQAGQADVLNVGGLAGVLGDPQTPIVHGNAHHNPVMTTAAELTAHSGGVAVHTAATNLANRETTGPLTGLVPSAQLITGSAVPADDSGLRIDRTWGPVKSTNIGDNRQAASLLPGPDYEDVHTITAPPTWMHDHMVMEIVIIGRLAIDNPGSLDLRLCYGAAPWCTINIPGTTDPDRHLIARAIITGVPVDTMTGTIESLDEGDTTHEITRRMNVKNALVANPNLERTWTVQARLNSGGFDSHLAIYSAFSRSLRPQP
jgi:hypothetical protein